MRRCSFLVLCLAVLLGCVAGTAASSQERTPSALRLAFHHIHVNDDRASHLLEFYQKLFDPESTKPVTLGAFRGIEAAGVFLLITPVRTPPPEVGSAGWHFGWGTVALDEAYDRHRMQEIDLKLPMPSFAKDLHVHLESEDPVSAAAWYRDRLGARVMTDSRNAEILPVNRLLRRPAAIVELAGITLALYKASAPLEKSRGSRIDHLAFRVDLKVARESGFNALEESRLGPFETMMIEGPDRLAIELVGAPALSRSSFAVHPSRN